MATQTILVADDEPQWLQLIGRVFSSHGCRVLPAPSCAGAIALLKSSRPDCAVLDFNLSDGDATAVCTAIRAREPRIPIVIFSSDSAAEECVGSKHLADKFISKTAPLEELFAVVNGLLTVRAN